MKNLAAILLVVNIMHTQDCNAEEVEIWGLCYSIENTTILQNNDNTSGEIPEVVCDLINLEIPPAKPGEKEVVDSLFHSGKHLITGIEWEITFDECRTHVRVIKDSLINRIETTVPKLPDRMDEE